jgi:putative tricarboxylic transport membrane protein
VTGVLVPLLTLGLPTSATAAIMLVAFQQYGLNPGPLLFQNNPTLVWGLIASLYIGNVMLLILNLPLAGIWVRLLAIPRPYLSAGILVFASLGVYSLHGSVFDLGTLCFFGLLGYVMRCADIPVSPAILGLILGPLAEQQFRRALAISQGDPTVFLTRPISATILAFAFTTLVAPLLYELVMSWRRKALSRVKLQG